jgi:hypothetical protein
MKTAWSGRKLIVVALALSAVGGCNETTTRSSDKGASSRDGLVTIDSAGGPVCGNGIREGWAAHSGELCDGPDLAGRICTSEGFGGGVLACKTDCTLDTASCYRCGDGQIGGAEPCDGAELGGKTCQKQGFESGELGCTPGCQLDLSKCTIASCGNGQRDPAEPCEGTNLGGKTCTSEGFAGGTLSCNSNCSLNLSACFKCGDNIINATEQCDGGQLGGKTCKSQGFDGGQLGCTPECTFSTTACTKCGDNVVSGTEQCDGGQLSGKTCPSFGFTSGTLSCKADCTFNTTACLSSPAPDARPDSDKLCVPGSKQCEGNSPQICDAAGQWQTQAACPGTCSGAGICNACGSAFFGADPTAANNLSSGNSYLMEAFDELSPAPVGTNERGGRVDTFAFKVMNALLWMGYNWSDRLMQTGCVGRFESIKADLGLVPNYEVSRDDLVVFDCRISSLEAKATSQVSGLATIVGFSPDTVSPPAVVNSVPRIRNAALLYEALVALPARLQKFQFSPELPGDYAGFINGFVAKGPALFVQNGRTYAYRLESNCRQNAVTLHELAHNIDYAILVAPQRTTESVFGDSYSGPIYESDESIGFYLLGWVDASHLRDGSTTTAAHADPLGHGLISGYAANHPVEDFAESFAAYVVSGNAFRSMAQGNSVLNEKYEWLKTHVFENFEFATGPAQFPPGVHWNVADDLGFKCEASYPRY